LQDALAFLGSAERVLYGSDWPLLSIETAVGLIEGLDVPESDKRAILGENARRLFHLDERPGPSSR
ncbi:MAG TPA: amidohydrolase family protein, partial [Thermoplasmata archaeon]